MVLLLGLAGRLVRCSDYAQTVLCAHWDVTRTKKDRAQGSGPSFLKRPAPNVVALASKGGCGSEVKARRVSGSRASCLINPWEVLSHFSEFATLFLVPIRHKFVSAGFCYGRPFHPTILAFFSWRAVQLFTCLPDHTNGSASHSALAQRSGTTIPLMASISGCCGTFVYLRDMSFTA